MTCWVIIFFGDKMNDQVINTIEKIISIHEKYKECFRWKAAKRRYSFYYKHELIIDNELIKINQDMCTGGGGFYKFIVTTKKGVDIEFLKNHLKKLKGETMSKKQEKQIQELRKELAKKMIRINYLEMINHTPIEHAAKQDRHIVELHKQITEFKSKSEFYLKNSLKEMEKKEMYRQCLVDTLVYFEADKELYIEILEKAEKL